MKSPWTVCTIPKSLITSGWSCVTPASATPRDSGILLKICHHFWRFLKVKFYVSFIVTLLSSCAKIGIALIPHLLCKQKPCHLALIILLPQQIYSTIRIQRKVHRKPSNKSQVLELKNTRCLLSNRAYYFFFFVWVSIFFMCYFMSFRGFLYFYALRFWLLT